MISLKMLLSRVLFFQFHITKKRRTFCIFPLKLCVFKLNFQTLFSRINFHRSFHWKVYEVIDTVLHHIILLRNLFLLVIYWLTMAITFETENFSKRFHLYFHKKNLITKYCFGLSSIFSKHFNNSTSFFEKV